MLDHSEWLTEAQSLMVGASKRVYHGAETRPNLVLRNEPAGWSAYCFSCKQHGYVPKGRREAVQYKADEIDRLPMALANLIALSAFPTEQQEDIVRFIIKKGMWLRILEPYLKGVVAKEQRLLINVGSAWLGRDYTGLREPKWYVYQEGLAYINGNDVLVLTEDVLSAIKVHAVLGCSALAIQGTVLKQHQIPVCLQAKAIVLAFDPDQAGQDCTRVTAKRLRNLDCCVYVLKTQQDLKLERDLYGLCATDSGHVPLGLGQILQLHQGTGTPV